MMQSPLLLIGFLLIFAPSVIYAQDTLETEAEVRAFILSRDQEIKDAVQGMGNDPALQDKAQSLINGQIDFEEMGRRSLGRYYEDLPTEDQNEFIDVFGQIVRSQSMRDLSVYEAPVTIESVTVNENHALVKTSVEIDRTTLEVDYRLHQKLDRWWVYDIIIDDVGTVDGYSASFQSFVRKRGFEAFMQSLQKRVDAIQNQ
ncbi:MAG: ABC transporter substrate-binding protein [Bacteroidetes bacterium]|nr:ABC transporter substrate-binding protein [Bacteroidota bacterium]